MLTRLAVLLALTLAACSPPAWDYVPVVQRAAGGLAEAPELATEAHLDRVEQVLAVYALPAERLAPTRLRVSGQRPDREVVWNVTTKAEDADWLRTHPAPAR